MYNLGKISFFISIFEKKYFEKGLQSLNNKNEYIHELLNQKSDCAIFTNKQTSLVFQDFLSYPNQQLIKRPCVK